MPTSAWGVPQTLDTNLTVDSCLTGDGAGHALLVWRRGAQDGAGHGIQEVVTARLMADGTWKAPAVLEAGEAGSTLGVPAAAVDDRGKGWVLWFSETGSGGSVSTEIRAATVDLKATSPFGGPGHPFIFPMGGYSQLRLAVGSDGSALAGWTYPRFEATSGATFSSVAVSRVGSSGVWAAPVSYHQNQFSAQALMGIAGDGRGAFVLEQGTGDDAFLQAEGYDFAAGLATASGVAGWEPASQTGLFAHATAWAGDGHGGLEAWLRYDQPATGEVLRQAWPRRRSAAGGWILGDAVALPRPAEFLSVFREPDDTGWMAGTGPEGLWVSPLNGVTLGSGHVLLAAPATATNLVAVRDAAGRPALLWIQQRNGTSEGIGFCRLEAGAWTTPTLLPGTAGVGMQNLRAVAGPGGLVATWEQFGDRVLILRAATWR
ncbi:MAG TPA: hypothetical protein VJ623_08565 [Holophagaceae bacterium]|nr:hypothetical protein [Holophagaceae bacterium]